MGELLIWLENHKNVCVSLVYFNSGYLKITMGYKDYDTERAIEKMELDTVVNIRFFLTAKLDNMYHELKGE